MRGALAGLRGDAVDAGQGVGFAETRARPGRREGAVDRPPAVRYPLTHSARAPRGERSRLAGACRGAHGRVRARLLFSTPFLLIPHHHHQGLVI